MDIPVLKYGQVVTVDGGRRQSFGSISGYSYEYREDHETVERRLKVAASRGDKFVWFNAQATIISNPPTTPDAIDHKLSDGQVVFVDSTWSEERGYWIVKRPGWMTGDNCQLVRPDAIYEVSANGMKIGATTAFRKHLPGEVKDAVDRFIDDQADTIMITRHAPNVYTLSGFSERV